jgi:anthranilate/para-aminobenzoate synthase component II
MKILVIDNYDSFTFNVVQYLWSITGIKPDVVRNDAITVEEVNQWDVIILSPGPGLPSDAGIMPAVIKAYFDKKPILGICHGAFLLTDILGGQVDACEGHMDTEHVVEYDNEQILVNSFHTQTITRLHRDAVNLAHDSDGNCEAWIDKNIAGITWHPERMDDPILPTEIRSLLAYQV